MSFLKLTKEKIHFATKGLIRLWLVLTILALASLADVMQYAFHQSGAVVAVAGLACAAIFKASALTAIYAFCRRNVFLRIIAIALIIVFALLSILNGGCWLFYDFGISRKLFTIMAETNPNEIGEFMPELIDKLLSLFKSPLFWISIAIFFALWIWLPKINRKLYISILGTLSVAGFLYLAYVFTTADFGRTDHSIYARSFRCVANYMKDRKVIKELNSKKRPLPFPESLASSKAAKKIVVIIGESASCDHLSIYGYPLQTTPNLDTISEGLFKFDNAIASSTSTAENMPRLISFMTDQPDSKEWFEYPSLLQVFNKLGYRTYWLSNQEYSGKWSNLSNILSSDADIVKYVGSIDSEDHYLNTYDDALIPEWQSALESGDSLQLTFLHLMGSHFQYSHRYPKSRQIFMAQDILSRMPRKWLDKKKACIIADYDNSILYSDSIIGVVINDLRNSIDPSVLIYVADHGENVYDDRDYRGRDSKFVNVPLVIYANDSYRQNNPEIIYNLIQSESNRFSTSELPQILLHLSGTEYELYDSTADPLSPQFIPRRRFVDGIPFYKDN